MIFGGDSGPTERIWEVAHRTKAPRSVFIECSFPDSLPDFAKLTGHLTPALLSRSGERCRTCAASSRSTSSANSRDTILQELGELAIDGLEAGRGGVVYQV